MENKIGNNWANKEPFSYSRLSDFPRLRVRLRTKALYFAILFPRAVILLTSATNGCPRIESFGDGSPQIIDFQLFALSQKFKITLVFSGYKKGKLLPLPIILVPARPIDLWHCTKGSQL